MNESTEHVLTVDDVSFMRIVFKDLIKSNGLATEIIESGDGVDGVKAYHTNNKPNLVTMAVNI